MIMNGAIEGVLWGPRGGALEATVHIPMRLDTSPDSCRVQCDISRQDAVVHQQTQHIARSCIDGEASCAFVCCTSLASLTLTCSY